MREYRFILGSTWRVAQIAVACGTVGALFGCGSAPASRAAFGTPLPPASVTATYTSKSEGYALFLPGTPKEETKQVTAKGHDMTMKVASLVSANSPVVYLVVTTPVPDEAASGDAAEFLSGVETGFLEPMKGTVDQRLDINLSGSAGREIVGNGTISSGAVTMKQKLRARFFMLPGRVLQIAALAPPADFDKNRAQIDKVFASLRLLKS